MNQLNLKIGDVWLDVPSKTRMKFKLENNIFFDSSRRREHTMNINLPLTPTNNKQLGWMSEIGTSNTAKTDYSLSIYSGNAYLMKGELIVRRTETSYSISVTTGYGAFETLADGVNLRDLDLSWDVMSTVLNDIEAGSFPQFAFTIPVLAGIGIAGNYGRSPNVGLQEADSIWGNTPYGTPIRCMYIMAILRLITNHFGYQPITGSFASDTELNDLIYIPNSFIPLGEQIVADMLPDMSVIDFIDSVSKLFCTGVIPDYNQKILKFSLLSGTAQRTDYLDWTSKMAGPFSRDWSNHTDGLHFKFSEDFKKQYKPFDRGEATFAGTVANDWWLAINNGVQDEVVLALTSNIFFKWSDTYIGLGIGSEWYEFDINVSIDEPENFELLTPVQDYWDLPSAGSNLGSFCLVINQNTYYASDGNDWVQSFANLWDYKHGNAKRIIEPKLSPVPSGMIGDTGIFPYQFLLPCIRNSRFNSTVGAGYADWSGNKSPNLISFKRGMSTNSNGDSFLFANSDVYDYHGVKNWNYGLQWRGENGLYAKFWEDWATFVSNGQEVSVPIWLTPSDWANLDLERPIMVKNVRGIIKSIDIDFPITKPAIVTFIKS